MHKSEIINVGNKSYVKVDAKAGKTAIGDDRWAIARISPQETAKKTIEAMRDAAIENKNYQCAHVRDDGEAIIEGEDRSQSTLFPEHLDDWTITSLRMSMSSVERCRDRVMRLVPEGSIAQPRQGPLAP